MSKCDNCRLRIETAIAFDIYWHGQEDCPYDVCPEIKTNADRIRAMSDEELADICVDVIACLLCPMTDDCRGRRAIGDTGCRHRWLDWLKQEVKDG